MTLSLLYTYCKGHDPDVQKVLDHSLFINTLRTDHENARVFCSRACDQSQELSYLRCCHLKWSSVTKNAFDEIISSKWN